jgi:circadian clock protein KaiB
MSTRAHPDYGNTDSIKEWKLNLFVTDWTPRCVVAYKNLNRICSEHLKDKCKIEVVDLLENPELARQQQIVAIPTLVRTYPEPRKIMIGDLADEERVIKNLGLEKTEKGHTERQNDGN